MSEHGPCPKCGAPVQSARDYGRYGSHQWVIRWTCGAVSNYDGPGEPCRNADERARRDEATQPGQDDAPRAFRQHPVCVYSCGNQAPEGCAQSDEEISACQAAQSAREETRNYAEE